MISCFSRHILELMATLLLLQIVITFAAAIPLETDFKLQQENAVSSERDLSPSSKEQFRQEMIRQLVRLQQAEADVMDRIRELEAQRIALSERKRSRYSNMCMLNVVACYRKRR